MLGDVVSLQPIILDSVYEKCRDSGVVFKKNAKGRYRFFFEDERGEVDRNQEQQQLFLLRSNGKKGTWDEPSKQYAKEWAAAISTVWENPTAQRVQLDYTANRLGGFNLPYARSLFSSAPNTDIGLAFKAAYSSFAANNPTWANRHLQQAIINMTVSTPWSIDWLIGVLKELTFGPGVTIYPHRYSAIRPVVEEIYGVDLPDFSDELKKWEGDQGHRFFHTVTEVQDVLLQLGFDLGPSDADGKWGNKSTEALLTFEQLDYGEKNVVPPEHVDGVLDQWSAKKMEEVTEMKGICPAF